MSLLDVITDFATAASYAVTRTAEGTLTDGKYTPGATSPLTIVAVVVPLGGRDLKILPEHRRVEDTRKVITATKLNLTDVVTIDGEAWEVFHIDGPWIAFGDTHYNCYAARQTGAAP